ncbi:MAG TPA: hypothetical protein VIY55_05820 [Acetobacteraceae bacterium]|jgi:hypothetical protein
MAKQSIVSKDAASAAVSFARQPECPAGPAGGRLEVANYRTLLDYYAKQERETGRRATHREVTVTALHKLLRRAR